MLRPGLSSERSRLAACGECTPHMVEIGSAKTVVTQTARWKVHHVTLPLFKVRKYTGDGV